MADNTDVSKSDTVNEEKDCETKCIGEDDKENNEQTKITLEEPADCSEGLRLSESQSDPVHILQLSGEQILAPETEDDGISIIPPSPDAYGDTPYLIPTSPGEQIGDENSNRDSSLVENPVKDKVTSSIEKSTPLKGDAASSEACTTMMKKPNSPCCKISFSQDSNDESLEISETQTEPSAPSRKRKDMDEPFDDTNESSTCSDKLSVKQMASRSKNHGIKIARIESERAEEPVQKSTNSNQLSMEEKTEKPSESLCSKSENPNSQIDSEEKEWHLQLSCATEPMECSEGGATQVLPFEETQETKPVDCTMTEALSYEETQKDTSETTKAPDKEVSPEKNDSSELPKDVTLPLFQIQKPTSIEQSSTPVDIRDDKTVFTHIQDISSNVLEVSEELTDECIGSPGEQTKLDRTIENSSNVKNTAQSSLHTRTVPEPITSTQISSDEMKDRNTDDKYLQSTQAIEANNSLTPLISHKAIKGRKYPVTFTDTLEEQECSISYIDEQTSSSISDASRPIKHKRTFKNKDGIQPANDFTADKDISIQSSEVSIDTAPKTLDLGIQVNIDSYECSNCSNHQIKFSPSSDKLEVKDHKIYKKIITTVRHIKTEQIIVNGEVKKTTTIEVKDEPIIEYEEEEISPTISSHRTSISHNSFSSGELADVSSLVTSKSISSSNSSSLFAFPRSSGIRRRNSQEKSILTSPNRAHQDASTDTDMWSDTKQQPDTYSSVKSNKSKWKLNSEPPKTSSLRSSSPEISVPDVLQPKQSRILLPGVRVMARWKDGGFYPGKVCAQDADKNKWIILYDDGGKIPVSEKDIIVISLLEKGQKVLAMSADGCYDPGIIKDYYKEGKEVGYIVERDYNETTRYPMSSVMLSSEEGLCLLRSNADTTSAFSETECDNITEGRRRQSPRMNVFQGKREKVKSCHSPSIEASLSDLQKSSSDGLPQRRSARKKQKQSYEDENLHPDVLTPSPQQLTSPRRRDSPSFKRKLHLATNEQCTDIPCTSKKPSHCETPIKTGEKESSFKSPKVQKAERCKISKLAGEPGKKDNENLFEGYAFLLTTADRKHDNEYQSYGSSTDITEEEVVPVNLPFDKNLVEKEIQARGGTVLGNVEEIQSTKEKQILLLSNDYHRTIKYIHCLAAGIPCVSHVWVKDCCATNKIQNYVQYLLPAGFDIINKSTVEWHGKKGLFKGLHILLSSVSDRYFVDTWSPILMAADAKIVHRIPPPRKSTDSPSIIGAVVTDSSCPQNVVRRATQMKIPILSVEWVIQCLITGYQLPVDSHPKFSYDFSV